MPKPTDHIRRRALRVIQDAAHPLFAFTLTAREFSAIAEVSRLSRDDTGKLLGYQRREVKKHVDDITAYLNSGRVLFPNPIILALSSRVSFTKSRGPDIGDELAESGVIKIPLPQDGAVKPAWVVDGQQRIFALSKCRNTELPILVSAFVADEVEIQRDQFLRVNITHPLPDGLVAELLPEVSGVLPARLAAKKLPAAICDWLDSTPTSPFHGLIRRPSGTGKRPSAVVALAHLMATVEESLSSPYGCLFPYRNIATGECDTEGVLALLVAYWSAVRRSFPDAWGVSPVRSRLMDGIGIRAMGRLMDRVMAWLNPRNPEASRLAEDRLRPIIPHCHWTSGRWEGLDGRRWDELEYTARQLRLVSNYLIRTYLNSNPPVGVRHGDELSGSAPVDG